MTEGVGEMELLWHSQKCDSDKDITVGISGRDCSFDRPRSYLGVNDDVACRADSVEKNVVPRL